ncbi:hypothetical protein WG915_06875 [Corynebacterium sp. H128]|uniref:hypothetical protein n=1 Tax=unclassified Corynebacterium TaxID=2624378 RepID=UPI003094BD80
MRPTSPARVVAVSLCWPLFLLLPGLAACSPPAPYDALARLQGEPGPVLTLPASELVTKDAQHFVIVCPGVTAHDVVAVVEDSVKVPEEGYDQVMNSFVSVTSDRSVETQRYATEELDLCSEGFADPLTLRTTATELTFRKEGTQWRLQAR